MLTVDVVSTTVTTMVCDGMTFAANVPIFVLLAVFWSNIRAHSYADEDIALAARFSVRLGALPPSCLVVAFFNRGCACGS